MANYIPVRGYYKQGIIQFLEFPSEIKDFNSEVIILFPIQSIPKIQIHKFKQMINLCNIGGDSLVDTESIYNA